MSRPKRGCAIALGLWALAWIAAPPTAAETVNHVDDEDG